MAAAGNSRMIVVIVLIILSVILISVATAISGIISIRLQAGDTKRRLLAISALSGFGFIISIVTALFGILYARSRTAATKNSKALGIVFLIMAILVLLIFVTVVALIFTTRNKPDLKPTEKNGLLASVFLLIGGFITLIIATILIFTITKGLSGAQLKDSLAIKRRPTSSSPTASSIKSGI